MSRPSSIPASLHAALISRCQAGASANALLAWIEETNVNRAKPIKTSRASIQRVIRSLIDADESGARLHTIRRARIRSIRLMDALEDIDDSFRACIEATETADRAQLRAIDQKTKLLYRRHLLLHRDLRLAGIIGAAADRLLEKHAAEFQQIGLDLAAQDAREDAGLPPEQGEPPLPESLFGPTIRLESIPLESQQIDTPNRADSHLVPTRVTSLPNEVSADITSSAETQSGGEDGRGARTGTPSRLESIPLESQQIDAPIRAESQPETLSPALHTDADIEAFLEAGDRREATNAAAGLPPEFGEPQLSPEDLDRVVQYGLRRRQRAAQRKFKGAPQPGKAAVPA